MKCFSVMRLKAVVAAALACAAAQADAADLANPTGFNYYGDGNGAVGYTGAAYAPPTAGAAYAPPTAGAGYAPGIAGYGAAPATYAGYAGYGYGGPAYAGYGYGGTGYGGCDACATGRCGRRRHGCSFGGNFSCCNNVWDGYCAGNCGYGAACGCSVKVHRRHRALGCGAGPCVDAACGAAAACAPRRHLCHLRRRCGSGCGPVDAGYGYDGSVMSAPETMYDGPAAQPNMANPNGAEQLQAPSPSLNYDEEPRPTPADDSST